MAMTSTKLTSSRSWSSGCEIPDIRGHQCAATRYRLLDTTRAYASAKLSESGEAGDVKRRHASYFLELFERVDGNSFTPLQAKSFAIFADHSEMSAPRWNGVSRNAAMACWALLSPRPRPAVS